MKQFCIYFYDLNDLNYGLQKMFLPAKTKRGAFKTFTDYVNSCRGLKAKIQRVEIGDENTL